MPTFFEKLRRRLMPAVALAVLLLLLQPACLFKKHKAAVSSTSPMRVVLVPFNLRDGGEDLRWAAMAAPIMLAKASLRSQDLNVVPLWETMPTTLEAAGLSRSITYETAVSIGTWLTAKWTIMGSLSPAKNGVSMMVDFMPANANLFPFRYLKSGSIDATGSGLDLSINQFLHYLTVKPLTVYAGKKQNMTSLKELAEALDREYGWFVNAEPGKAQKIVADLASSDNRLARILFNPTLYPNLAPPK